MKVQGELDRIYNRVKEKGRRKREGGREEEGRERGDREKVRE